MKKVTLIFIGLLFQMLSAQTIIIGDQKNSWNSSVPLKIVGKNDSLFYVLRASSKQNRKYIEKYSQADMKLRGTMNVTIENEKKSYLVNVFYFNGRFLLFRAMESKGNTVLFMQTVFEDGKTPSTPLEEIFKFETIITPAVIVGETPDVSNIEFFFSASNDEKLLLLVCKEGKRTAEGKKTFHKIHSKLLSTDNFSLKWEKQIPTTYGSSKIAVWDFRIDNSENVFFFYNYINPDNRKRTAIGCLHKNNTSIVGTDVKVENTQEIEDLHIEFDESTIYCSGIYKLYSKEEKWGNQISLMGAFFQKVNILDFKTIHYHSKPLGEEITKKLSVKGGYKYFRVAHMKIINEEIYSVAELYYPYGPLVIFKTNKQGDIEWINAINRKYVPAGNGFQYTNANHYHVFDSGGNLFIIFNENSKNFKKSKDIYLFDEELDKYKSYEEVKGTNAICVKIGAAGIIDRSILWKNRRFSLLFIPKTASWGRLSFLMSSNNLSLPISNTSAIIYLKHDKGKGGFHANLKGDDKFVKIIFK